MVVIRFLQRVFALNTLVHFFLISPPAIADSDPSSNARVSNSSAKSKRIKSQSDNRAVEHHIITKTDHMADDLMGNGEGKEQLYNTAQEVLRMLAIENEGDMNKILDSLAQAQKNPKAFYKSLSAEQREMIQNLYKITKQKRKLNPDQ